MQRRSKVEILGVKSQKCQGAQSQGLRTSSQFLQGSFPTIPSPKKLRLQSIGSDLEATFTNVFQVYRQRATHLESDERIGAKDEKEQRRECKAEFPALTVAATALPRLTRLHRKWVCSYSILSSIDSSSPSSSTSRGSTTTPRSPTRLQPPSTTSTGAGSSRTRAMCVK